MIATILTVLLFLLAPAGVLWLCRRVKWLGKTGPVLVLYILGVIVGNVIHPAGMKGVQDALSNSMVPLAIPLMLFACTFSRQKTRSQLLALVTGLCAVTVMVIVGFFIFGPNIDDSAKVGGMMTGTYTGGTINTAAIKVMLGAPDETFILLNAYDMIISFLYLAFLLTFGIKWFRKILPSDGIDGQEVEQDDRENPYKGLFTASGLKEAGFLLLVDLAVVAVAGGLGLLAGDKAFMVVFILALTTLGIALSFWKPVKTRRYGYEVGMYFIYVFSMVVASMADLRQFDLGSSLSILGYLTLVIFGSLLLQVVLARIFRIDADTMTVSSVTYICSPPFVPMITAAMKNRSVLACGLTIGIFGYAIGNYLGYLVYELLSLFGG